MEEAAIKDNCIRRDLRNDCSSKIIEYEFYSRPEYLMAVSNGFMADYFHAANIAPLPFAIGGTPKPDPIRYFQLRTWRAIRKMDCTFSASKVGRQAVFYYTARASSRCSRGNILRHIPFYASAVEHRAETTAYSLVDSNQKSPLPIVGKQ